MVPFSHYFLSYDIITTVGITEITLNAAGFKTANHSLHSKYFFANIRKKYITF